MIAGVGTDMVEIDRIRRAIEKNPRFWSGSIPSRKLPAAGVRPIAGSPLRPVSQPKEAVSKALGTGIGPVGLKEIEVINAASGQPQVALYGKAQELAQSRNIQRVHISLRSF